MLRSKGRAARRSARLPLLFVPLSCAPQAVAPSPAVSDAPTAAAAESRTDDGEAEGPFETCYSSFTPSGDASGDLARLVRNCGPTGGMRAVSSVQVGRQAAEDPVDRYAFQVPSAGKCYRIYASSDGTVQDLDLLLRGPSGDAVVADLTHDSWPVLPPREPVCFTEPGTYLLEVSVYRGSGRYALQVWGR